MKECKNNNSLSAHQRFCKLNPERQFTPFQDIEKQKEIAKLRKENGVVNQWSNDSYVLSDETRKKLSEGTKKRNANESEETKAKRKATIAKRVESGEWHVSLTKNLHYNYNGVDLHGKWELEYAKWLDKNQIKWQRCKDSFPYEFEGKIRRYTPDFYLVDSDEYIEIKGYKTEKDAAKWSQFPSYRTLKVLFESDLKELGVF
jgi:lipopolysaccharide export LptBFGC system permease protein LptF